MTANKAGSDLVLKVKDIRLLRVCRDYLVKRGMLDGSQSRWSDAEGYASDIIKCVLWVIKDSEVRDDFIREMTSHAKSQCVSSDSVEWLERSDKACCWLWLKIRMGRFYDYINTPLDSNGRVMGSTFHSNYFTGVGGCYNPFGYKELGFDFMPEPSSHDTRLRLVIEYLDRFSDDFDYKSELLSYAHKEWADLSMCVDPLKWVDRKDEEQCEWVWDYFYSNVILSYKWFFIDGVYITLPTTPGEKYLFSYAFFHNWIVPSAEKELLVNKMKNAWGQKKFRRKKATKRSINTYIDVGVGKKLDELVFHYDLTIHRTIEMLIKKEYERLKDKGI